MPEAGATKTKGRLLSEVETGVLLQATSPAQSHRAGTRGDQQE
jgi:hypothetical protein